MGLSAVDVAATSRVLALFEQGSSSRIRRRYQRPSRPSAAPSLSCRPSGKVVVTWAEEPGLSVLPVTGYVTRIYEEGSQTPTVEARGRERKQEFTTLPPGFRAVATVAVENGLGEGEESAPSLPVRVHCRPLRPPAPPVVADNLGAVEIAWANELSLEETGAHPVTEWRLQLRCVKSCVHLDPSDTIATIRWALCAVRGTRRCQSGVNRERCRQRLSRE